MSIEFQCTECNKTLRVPAEHAGKIARCPNCNCQTQVPAETSDGFNSPSSPSERPLNNPLGASRAEDQSTNPFQSPAYAPTKSQPTSSGQGVPRAVPFEEIFSYAFDAWKNNLGILVGVTACVFGASFLMGILSQIALAVVAQNARDLVPFVYVGSQIIVNCITIFLGIGQARINLDIARNGNSEFSRLFSGADKFLPVLGTSILAGIAVTLGFLLLIVPGIFLCLYFWGFYFQIVDGKSKAMDSFFDAKQYCSINMGTSLLMAVVGIGIALAGFLAACVGILFAIPLVSLLWAVAYLKMSGQLASK